MFSNNRPMTPQELEAARRRMDQLHEDVYSGAMPRNIGEGLSALGDGIALRRMKNREQQQFPAAPGAQPDNSALSPIKRIVQALSQNRAPWQFPEAPAQQSAPQATPSPQPANAGKTPVWAPPEAQQPMTMGAARKDPSSFFGMFSRKNGGGLY
jgi:hypothetical protein